MKVLECKKCGWHSAPLSQDGLRELGVPWYCDNCGEKVTWFYDIEDMEEYHHIRKVNMNAWERMKFQLYFQCVGGIDFFKRLVDPK